LARQHIVDPQDNNAQMVWDEFISQHGQVSLTGEGGERTPSGVSVINGMKWKLKRICA
jgi:hypothetical protein